MSSNGLTKKFPRHVAIVMDGNGRWAQARGLPRQAGYKTGLKAAREVIKGCIQRKIEYLTLFAFSSENWRRPVEEVSFLIQLLKACLNNEVKQLHGQAVRLRFIGDLTKFPKPLQQTIQQAETLTQTNPGLSLIIALNYGGQWDIVEAVKKIGQAIAQREIIWENIDSTLLANQLSTANIPSPDLFIRTSGERRISNFLLWQLAYTELYFTDTLWPDFDATALDLAFDFYASRERRFGHTQEQLKEA